MNSLPPKEYASLPKLNAPAGYICVLRDIDRDVYRIDSTDHPATYVYTLLSGAVSTFGVELVSILETGDLNDSKSELYEHYGATLGAEWFELDPYQLQELRDSRLQINAYESCYLTEQSVQAETRAIDQPYMDKYQWESLPKLEPPAGYVYLLQDVEISARYKIGRTNHPKRRLNNFIVKLPFRTEVVLILKTNNAAELERELHQRFAESRADGEWFDLSTEDVAKIRIWETGRSIPSENVTLLDSTWRAATVSQRVPQAERPDTYVEELPYFDEDERPDIYIEERPYIYRAEPRQHSQAEERKMPTWLIILLILVFFGFAGNLLGGPNLDSTTRSPSSSASRPNSTVRATKSTINRSTETSANRTSAATLYVKTSDSLPANVRVCPRRAANCKVIDGFLPGRAVRQLGRVSGDDGVGSENWIKFRHNGRIAYIHSSVLSASRVSTPTYYVATSTNKSANVRSRPCKTANCSVIDVLFPGHPVTPQEAVAGEDVHGSVIWIKFNLKGKTAYIHRSVLTAGG